MKRVAMAALPAVGLVIGSQVGFPMFGTLLGFIIYIFVGYLL